MSSSISLWPTAAIWLNRIPWLLLGLPGVLLLSGCNNIKPKASKETYSVVADGRSAKEESDIKVFYDSLAHYYQTKDSLALKALVSKTCALHISTPGWQGCCQIGKGAEALLSGNNQAAINPLSAAANYFAEAGMWRLQGICRRNLGGIYAGSTEPQKSNDQYQKFVDLYKTKAETRADSLTLLEVLTTLILGKQSTNHYLEAYRNAELGLSIARQLKDPKKMETFLYFISVIYAVFGEEEAEHKCALERLELMSSLPQTGDIKRDILFLRLSLVDTPEEAAALKTDFQQAATAHQYWFVHQGQFWCTYAGLMSKLNQEEAALYWYRKAVDILQVVPDDSQYLWARIRILNHYLKNRQYQTVLKEVPMILPLTRKILNREMEVALFDQYSNAFFHTGQADSAYHYLRHMMALQDTIRQINPEKNFMRQYMSSIFEKEQEIQQLRQEQEEAVVVAQLQRQRLLLWVSGLVLLLLGGLAFAFYRNFRLKQRAADELAQANAALAAEQKKLLLSNAKLRRFSGVVSHDILSNLDLILSTGNVLVGSQPKKENLSQYYSLSQRTSRQLKDYCLGLLEEARSAVGGVGRVSDPMPIVEAVLARQEIALLNKGCKVTLAPLSPTLLPPSIAEQVFQNLISNALRYGLDGPNPRLRIAEEQTPLGGKLRWVVEDNGPGVPPSLREAIFDKTNAEGINSQGQNLGLGLLRETLKGYGAQIWVEETVGGGARFVVELQEGEELQGN